MEVTEYNDDGVGMRWQSSALLALQEATEAFIVHLFEDAYVHRMTRSSRRLTRCIINCLQESVRDPREAGDDNAEGHPACAADTRAVGRDGLA